MKWIKIIAVCIIWVLFTSPVSGQKLKVKLENQVSGWVNLNVGDTLKLLSGGRFIPVITLSDTLDETRKLDAEVSINTYGNVFFNKLKYDDSGGDLKPYRLWIRYSGTRFELRAGLQKINFGSASVLRPLMWFDKIDTRDPLQITDGVYGLLGRYYFRNNANVWLWGLYGNRKARGWDVVPGKKTTPEFGGRFQTLVHRGEAALSYHHRKADFSGFYPPSIPYTNPYFDEDKIAIDCKWDLGAGLWIEYVCKHNNPENPVLPEWQTFLNAGIDYTFPVGNGINLASEFFRMNNKSTLWGRGNDQIFSVITCNYPFGLLNTLMAMAYYDWNSRQWYRFVNLQRKYDYWSFYLLAFWNPDKVSLYNAGSGRNMFAGKGIQLMAVVNF
jgi:hypothetical protein